MPGREKPRIDGGVREIAIGVPRLDEAIAHWRAFGYAPRASGRLDARAALALYGVARSLRAVRLGHGRARSGLIRLWEWGRASRARVAAPAEAAVARPGLTLAPMRTLGSRWSVHRTQDITAALAWARNFVLEQPPADVTGPVVHAHGGGAASINLALFTPLYRHVVLVRHGIAVPRYGTPNPRALLGTSEACHVGLVLSAAAREATEFYGALGFRRASERRVAYDARSVATQMFPLRPGEALIEIDFDDPRAGPGPLQLPGRLRVFLLESDAPGPAHVAQIDDPGYGPYLIRSTHARASLEALGARVDGDGRDEFGESALRFRAPDGHLWISLASSAPSARRRVRSGRAPRR